MRSFRIVWRLFMAVVEEEGRQRPVVLLQADI